MGQVPHRASILNITNAIPCSVETTEEHGFFTDDFVRITDLNGAMPIPRGSDPLNNYRFQIVKTSDDTFNLYHPVTHKPVDSTNFTPYVSGGKVNKIEPDFVYLNDNEE
jgi:hypothetical protein